MYIFDGLDPGCFGGGAVNGEVVHDLEIAAELNELDLHGEIHEASCRVVRL